MQCFRIVETKAALKGNAIDDIIPASGLDVNKFRSIIKGSIKKYLRTQKSTKFQLNVKMNFEKRVDDGKKDLIEKWLSSKQHVIMHESEINEVVD